MKEALTGKYFLQKDGFSTLEILIAFAVLITALVSTITISFSNQSIAITNETSHEALFKAEASLEKLKLQSQENFYSVASSQSSTLESIYSLRTIVTDITQCKKRVRQEVTWAPEALRPQNINLSTFLTSPKTFFEQGNDCGGDEPNDDWSNPETLSSIDFTLAGAKATDIDVINKIVFMTADDPSFDKEDFYVFDATDGANPIFSNSLQSGYSLNSLDVVFHTDGNYYAFVAHASSTNQFQVIRVPGDLSSAPTVVAERTLPGVSGTYPEGRSIFYYKNRVYVGTHYNGPNAGVKEFHIYDVTNPSAPLYLDSLKVYHNVNNIIVREQQNGNTTSTLAYLATSGNTEDLIVLDVSDPQNPLQMTSFNLAGSEDTKSLFAIGNKLYLGRLKTSPSRPDFYILNIADPSNGISVLGQTYLGAEDINGIRVAGSLAFLATGDANLGFKVLDISNSGNIIVRGSYNYSEQTSDLDYEDNLVYTANRANDALRIIRSRP